LGSAVTGNADLNVWGVKNDHGIYNQLNDIRKYFPHSKVVPIIIGDGVSRPVLDSLFNLISKNCLANCLLVASVDFSHYLPADLADIHDLYSLRNLNRLNSGSYENLEVDSPQSLYLVMQMAKARHAGNFDLFAHTNSGRMLNDPDAESTSHVFASYSRIYSFSKTPDHLTFTVASGLSRNLSQKGVGDRFFYGVDEINPDLQATYSASQRIKITPGGISRIRVAAGRLWVEMGPELAVAGVTTTPDGGYVLFLPLEASTSAFLRGDLKAQVLESLLGGTASASGIKTDVKSGIIYMETP
jgi:hypothetical protein